MGKANACGLGVWLGGLFKKFKTYLSLSSALSHAVSLLAPRHPLFKHLQRPHRVHTVPIASMKPLPTEALHAQLTQDVRDGDESRKRGNEDHKKHGPKPAWNMSRPDIEAGRRTRWRRRGRTNDQWR